MDKTAEIRFTPALRDALDHFTVCFGIRIAFFDPTGRELLAGVDRDCCRFCRMVREELGLVEQCRNGDRRHLEAARETGKMQLYACHAGMAEAVKPVFYAGFHLGYIMMGQFRGQEEPAAALLRKWRGTGRAEAEIVAAFREAALYPPDKVRHIAGMFEMLVDSTVQNRCYHVEGEFRLLRLQSLLAANSSRLTSAAAAAEHLGCSVSTLSHCVRRQTGSTFKRMEIESRLNAAEDLLRHTPGMTVIVAAQSCGFDDPYYFSRLFRRYRGLPPSQLLPRRRPPAERQ